MSEPLNSFPDPYEQLPSELQHRTSIVIDKRLWSIINSCRGHRGTLQTTINILLAKLHAQLERNNLTSFCPREYEHAVLSARLELGYPPRSAEPPTTSETPDRDVGRGTPSVALGTPGRRRKSADFGVPSPDGAQEHVD